MPKNWETFCLPQIISKTPDVYLGDNTYRFDKYTFPSDPRYQHCAGIVALIFGLKPSSSTRYNHYRFLDLRLWLSSGGELVVGTPVMVGDRERVWLPSWELSCRKLLQCCDNKNHSNYGTQPGNLSYQLHIKVLRGKYEPLIGCH